MKKQIFFLLAIISIFFVFNTIPAFGYSQNFHQESYVNLPTTCAGVRFWVTDYFTTNTVDINSISVSVYSRNWANKTTRELTFLGSYSGGYGHQFMFQDLKNGGGGCLVDANNIYVRVTTQAAGGGYQNFFFDAPLVQPPSVAANATLNVDVKLFTNNNGYGVGNVGLVDPPDGAMFTTNVIPDRSAWIIGPRDPANLGVIPSIGSFFDYGIRLVTGPGPEDFQWGSPEVFYPGFHSGSDATGCVRHISDNAPGLAPPPAIAFDPCAWPDSNSHGTQMYKPGTNFTDPYPYDGIYRWNMTYGIGPWNAGSAGSPSVMSAQQSYWAGHAISQADQTARTLRLLTDISPVSITPNGSISGSAYVPSQNMTFTANVRNNSSGIATNVNTPVAYSVTNTATGSIVWTGSATIGSSINPGNAVNATSGPWFSVAGNYRVDVCVNSPYTRLTVQGGPVCANLPFTVGLPPTPTATPTPTPVTYTISGNVFDDINKNFSKDSEPNILVGSPLIVVTNMGTGITTNYPTTAGVYSVSNLTAGTYRIGVSNLPVGYTLTFPVGFGYQVNVPCVSTLLSILPSGGDGSCE